MDISIIYVNYKTNDILIDSIRSLKERSIGYSYEIIIVDNSNEVVIFEDLKKRVLECDDRAIIINANGNIGFGRANNLGAQYAKGEYLLFLNTDTLLVNDVPGILKDYLDNNQEVGIVGPNILNKEMKPSHSFYKNEKNLANYRINNSIFKSIQNKLFNKRSDYNYTGKPLKLNGYVCGACMMIRKDLFKRVDGFDNDIFMYAEETLLNYRVMHETDKKIFNIPEAKIIHLEGTSFGDYSKTRIEMMVDGNWIYLKKALGINEAVKYAKREIMNNKIKGIIQFVITRNKNNYFTLMSIVWKQKIES